MIVILLLKSVDFINNSALAVYFKATKIVSCFLDSVNIQNTSRGSKFFLQAISNFPINHAKHHRCLDRLAHTCRTEDNVVDSKNERRP